MLTYNNLRKEPARMAVTHPIESRTEEILLLNGEKVKNCSVESKEEENIICN